VIIARRFIAGFPSPNFYSPAGTAEINSIMANSYISRPCGTHTQPTHVPGDKSPGYFHTLLRSRHTSGRMTEMFQMSSGSSGTILQTAFLSAADLLFDFLRLFFWQIYPDNAIYPNVPVPSLFSHFREPNFSVTDHYALPIFEQRISRLFLNDGFELRGKNKCGVFLKISLIFQFNLCFSQP